MKTKPILTLTAFMALLLLQSPLCGAAGSDKAVTPNRTVPVVTPPKSGLEFSAHPTAEEISSARVFEEQLVPLGEPTADENTALASAVDGLRQARPAR